MNPMEDVVCVESIRHIMQIFSSKWAFMVMGELHPGPKRFNQIHKSIYRMQCQIVNRYFEIT